VKLHLLGTGTSQGVPVINCNCVACSSSDPVDKRFRSAAVFEINDVFLLVDTGPDLRMQLLKANIPRIDAILYTHEHNDHVIGLDDIRPYNFKQKSDIPIYGQSRVLREIKSRFAYIFSEIKYPGAPGAKAFEISGDETIQIKGIEITPINVLHGRIEILGYRIGNAAFITDASFISDSELKKLQGLDVLVINALRMEQHPAHFNLDEALELIEKVNPKRSFITHVSHLMGKYTDWKERLPQDVYGAYDGIVIEL